MPPECRPGVLCALGDVLLDVVVATRPGADRHGISQHGISQHGPSQHGPSQHGPSQHGSSRRGSSRRGTWPRGGREHGAWEHGADTAAATWVGAGGQAANVAAWTVALGGRARVVASRASDLAGQLVAADLRRRGVELAGPVVGTVTGVVTGGAAGVVTGATGVAGGGAAGSGATVATGGGAAGSGTTGVVVAVSECGGERTMLTDRGVCPRLSAAELRDEWFAGCDRLHLPMYSLVDAPIREAALAAARQVPRLSVDLSSVSVLREIGAAEVSRLLGLLAPDVIFANQPESEWLAAAPAVTDATLVVKLGAAGVRVNGRLWPARPARPVDSTGAGDAFAAGFLLDGVELGLEAAARAVSQLGAMP